jgi:hypothetical protein
MLICKNHPKRKYKGDEPSPKGLGWCAHGEKKGTIRKGLDNNKWVVKKVNSGSLRWVKYACDNKSIKTPKSSVVKFKKYYTHFNGTRPYLVEVNKKVVRIYEQSNNYKDYTFKKEYKVLKVYIGKTQLTEFSTENQKVFDGNTILLKIRKSKYVYISYDIEEFSTPNDDIISYYSPVGNSDVPYPFAFSKTNTYIFNDEIKYISNDDFFDKGIKTEKQTFKYTVDNYYKLEPFFTSVHFNVKPKISLQKFNEIRQNTIDDVSMKDLKTILKMYSVSSSGSNKQELVNRLKRLRGIDLFYRSLINKAANFFKIKKIYSKS